MLGANLHVFVYEGTRVIRYLLCIIRTLLTLLRERPRIVFAQNPSVILITLLIAAKPLFRYKLISDAHYVGIKSCSGSRIYQAVLDTCNKMVDMVIVTNSEHQKYVRSIGGNAVVCEDPLPDISKYSINETNDSKTVYYICSFDVDEPYNDAFKAAKILHDDDYIIYVTGNYRRVKIDPSEYKHIRFLGYIPIEQFYNNLYNCSVVLDLTNYENCLVCGAYEAMVAEKPLVTSDTVTLKSYFTKGTVFTTHDAIDIANAVKHAYRNRNELKKEIKDWKENIFKQQNENKLNIFRELGICDRPEPQIIPLQT